jgi:uncharacterized protein YjdB
MVTRITAAGEQNMIKKISIKLLSVIVALCAVLSVWIAPASRVSADSGISLTGSAHVQNIGDTAGSYDGTVLSLGTEGQSLRMEAITLAFTNDTGISGSIRYRVHVQNIGWMDWAASGQSAGTSGQSLRLEGIEIELTGDIANYYTVEYMTHIQNYGDAQGWVSNGALAGTTGESLRLEELKVKIVPLDTSSVMGVSYRVHRQDYGWETSWASDGSVSGTTGQGKRLEAISINLTGSSCNGGIEYMTHVQDYGWESAYSVNGEMSGTQGQGKRLEAIRISLTGDIANHYDVYYRVHAQDYGWLGWAKDGEDAGTSGLSKRLEAIQIVLVVKNAAAPSAVAGITSVTDIASVTGSSVSTNSAQTVSTESTADFYPYRSMLSSTYKALYDEAYAALKNGNTTVTPSVKVKYSSNVTEAIYAVYLDHPELVWITGSSTISTRNDYVTKIVFATYDISDTTAERELMVSRFNAAAQKIIDKAMTYNTVIQREVYVHNAICEAATYSDSDYSQSAYSALVMGKSVCAGYSRAFQYIMQQCGVACYYVRGTAFSGYTSGNHAWNIISIGSSYYNVDVSWDDTYFDYYGHYCYDYFNLSDASAGLSRTRNKASMALPACTDKSLEGITY